MRRSSAALLAVLLILLLSPASIAASESRADSKTAHYDVGQPTPDGTGHVRGRVVEFRWHEPLQGIRVTAHYQGGDGSWIASATALTDEYGSYDIGGLAGGAYRLTIHDDRGEYRDAAADTYMYPGRYAYAAVDFSAYGTGRLKGRVVSSVNGQPVSGMHVTACRWDRDTYWQYRGVTSGPDGAFDLELLPSGSYMITADDSAKNYFHAEWGESAPLASNGATITLAIGETREDHEVTVTPAGHIRGQVTSDRGVPLSTMGVWAEKWDAAQGKWSSSRWVYTDPDGRYDLKPLAPGAYRIRFDGDGDRFGAWWPSGEDPSDAETITVALSQDVPGIDVELTTGATIGGRVTDAVDGTPVSFADMYLYRSENGTWTEMEERPSSGPQGEYAFRRVRGGTYRVGFKASAAHKNGEYEEYMSSWHGGESAEEAEDIVVETGESSLGNDVPLFALGHLGGKVTSAMSGRILPGIDVSVFERQPDGSWAATATARSFIGGVWRLDGRFDGTYRVVFHDSEGRYHDAAYRSGGTLATADDVVMAPGVGRMDLDRALPAIEGTIEGTITGTGGVPLPRMTVALYQIYGSTSPGMRTLIATQSADAEGRYRFVGLESYEYALTVTDPAGEYMTVQTGDSWWDRIGLSPGGSGRRDVLLPKKGAISGTVVDDVTSLPIEGVEVAIQDWAYGSTIATGVTDSDGRYLVRRLGVPFGDYRVSAVDPYGRHASAFAPSTAVPIEAAWFSPEPGETLTADVRLGWCDVGVERVAGANRYDTAALLSRRTFATADCVVLATGEDFPDALAGGPLASAMKAPVLLVRRTEIPVAIATEITRLGAKRVVILGSDRVVGGQVVAALERMGIPRMAVERLAGVDRYDTARLIAQRLRVAGGSASGTAFVATGAGFADAVSAGVVASQMRVPLLLVGRDAVPDSTASAIRRLGISRCIVVGSGSVISTRTARSLPQPERLGGPDRYETAARVSRWARQNGFKLHRAFVSDGHAFPDLIIAGPAAAASGGLLYPVRASVPSATVAALREDAPWLGGIVVLGGRTPESLEPELKDLVNRR